MLDRTTRLLKQHYLRVFRELGIDLSTEQWVLLNQLWQQGECSQTSLANTTYKDAPTVSRIIDKLVTKKLVERRRFPNDRRRYQIIITERGRQTYDRLTPHVEELRRQTWAGLSASDFGELTRILSHIRANFEEE
jgi:DNA-binding MarR family transcriptional regulator